MSFTQRTARVTEWTEDPDPRVRRLVSEGTRPRLPWAGHLRLPVEPVLAILGHLRADPAETVRRSVANYLNDLAKEYDEQVVDLLGTGFAEDVPETTWIVRHALRNHLKRGDPRVMTLFGYAAPQLSATLTARPDRVRIGDGPSAFRFTSAPGRRRAPGRARQASPGPTVRRSDPRQWARSATA